MGGRKREKGWKEREGGGGKEGEERRGEERREEEGEELNPSILWGPHWQDADMEWGAKTLDDLLLRLAGQAPTPGQERSALCTLSGHLTPPGLCKWHHSEPRG